VNNRLQKAVLQYGLPLAILFAAGVFSRTAPFWGWHLLHGFHIKTNGMRIWVPLTYRAIETRGQGSLALLPFQGYFPSSKDSVTAGTVMIDFAGSREEQPLEIRIGEGSFTWSVEGGFIKKSDKELPMAGLKGHCAEHAGEVQPGGSSLVDLDTVKVYCWFGENIRASFLGSSSNEQKFFEIISSARQEKGNL
jgi:hypothetical protein